MHINGIWEIYLFIGSFLQILLKNSVSAFWFSALNSNWIGLLSDGSTFWNEMFHIYEAQNLQTFNHWGTTPKETALRTVTWLFAACPLLSKFSALQGSRQLPFLFNTVPVLLCKVVGLNIVMSRCFLTVTAQILLQGCHHYRKQQTFLYCFTHHSWATPGDNRSELLCRDLSSPEGWAVPRLKVEASPDRKFNWEEKWVHSIPHTLHSLLLWQSIAALTEQINNSPAGSAQA